MTEALATSAPTAIAPDSFLLSIEDPLTHGRPNGIGNVKDVPQHVFDLGQHFSPWAEARGLPCSRRGLLA